MKGGQAQTGPLGTASEPSLSIVSAYGLAESQKVADSWEAREEETKSDFFFFLRTVLLYKGMFSCLSSEVMFHHFKHLLTARFIHLAIFWSRGAPWGFIFQVS